MPKTATSSATPLPSTLLPHTHTPFPPSPASSGETPHTTPHMNTTQHHPHPFVPLSPLPHPIPSPLLSASKTWRASCVPTRRWSTGSAVGVCISTGRAQRLSSRARRTQSAPGCPTCSPTWASSRHATLWPRSARVTSSTCRAFRASRLPPPLCKNDSALLDNSDECASFDLFSSSLSSVFSFSQSIFSQSMSTSPATVAAAAALPRPFRLRLPV